MRWKAVDASGAWFSECDLYRYLLWRDLPQTVDMFSEPDDTEDSCLFLMLNPSTADATKDDPTIKRCIDYATQWGYAQLMVANIFAWRSTDPDVLPGCLDPVGPANDKVILLAAHTANLVVCAWGNHGDLNNRGSEVLRMLEAVKIPALCLNQNAGGQPVHPLYQPKDLRPKLIIGGGHH